ncbi:LIM and calponin homology domains-containing protein 1a isoform X3 [Amia ocellicauda]|uniref:LIM and calponin homology domains-containing protein 1a isoform X3 n=1 Tax=Amia ocellicauda TaxID=2972642 RepID=UPI003463C639
MASPGLDLGRNQQQDSSAEPAFQEAQKWIEAVTGRRFGDRDFRGGLENGILLCELLSSIKPGLVKKINRLPTPIAGLDNLTLFLRGCEELGLKGTQLFDPGDLQDTSVRANLKGSDCSRKLKNVLITIYWLGKAANSCASYNGPTLDLKEFEGLLSQMRKEAEDIESPKRSIRDSGYIDCWDSERSDSLSPPRHGRDDSFDSLDSFGSRSQQTPSPDVVIRGSSDGRGSDSETDTPHRKLPDVRKDDMLARRTSYNEPRNVVPFNQYLPNKSNQSGYVPAPLRKKKAEREESRKSWSTATSPIGGERPFSHPETILEEHIEVPGPEEEEDSQALSETQAGLEVQASPRPGELQRGAVWSEEHEAGQSPHGSPQLKWPGKNEQEVRKLQKLEKAGIRVLPASARYSSPKTVTEEAKPSTPDIILRRENEFLRYQQEVDWDSDEEEQKVPDVEKDDLASRRARMNQFKPKFQHNQFLPPLCSAKDKEKWEAIKKASQQAQLHRQPQRRVSESEAQVPEVNQILTQKMNRLLQPRHRDEEEEEEEGEEAGRGGLAVVPNIQRDDLAKRKAQSGLVSQREPQAFVKASITQSDLEKWERLKLSTDTSESEARVPEVSQIVTRKDNPFLQPQHRAKEVEEGEEAGRGGLAVVPNVQRDDLAKRRTQSGPVPHREPQAFVKASITQSDLEKWERLKLSTDTSEESTPPLCQACIDKGLPVIHAETAALDDLASRRARVGRKAPSSKPRFVHFGPVTEIDQKRWERLSIAKAGVEDEPAGNGNESDTLRRLLSAAAVATPTISCGFLRTEQVASDEVTQSHGPHSVPRSPVAEGAEKKAAAARSGDGEQEEERQPMPEKDDMMARRTGGPQKGASGQPFNKFLPLPGSVLAKKEAVPESPKGRKEQSVFNHSAVWSGGLEAHEQDADPVLGEGEDTDEGHSFRASAFQEGSDVEEEDEERIPDLEKDDMHARRTGIFQKAGSPAFNLFLPVPGSLKQKQTALEASDQDSVRKSSSSGLSCSAELYQQPVSAVVTAAVVTPKESPEVPRKLLQRNKEELVKDSPPDMEKDDMRTRRTLISLKQTMSAPTHFLPVPASQQARTLKAEADEAKPRRRPSWLDDDLPPIFSHRTSVSDDGESVSMIDMRCEDEAILQPHSKARHEHLHNLHNKLREEEDQWQDDLARWKNRRRSASQDLIKKEEERKMMERLMTGEGSLSERRKSIKTYREIVEEKERRERELHEAYRNAKTPEEAEAVLQRYTQRFTISEAVLERLQLPRCLERSVSVDPSAPTSTPSSSSPTKESNAMKYLRQQSLPAPKFTATVEATIGVVPLLQAGSPHTSPTRTVSSKAVPLLTPKPYSQPGLKSVKVDGMVRVNGKTGELFSRAEDEIEGTTTRNLLSPSRSLVFESTARLTPSPVKTPESPRKETSSQDRAKQDTAPVNSHMPTKADAPPVEMSEQESVICASLQSAQKHDVDTAEMLVDTSPARPTSLPTELQKESAVSEEGAFTAVAPGENRQAETAGEMAQKEGRCVDEKPSSYVNSVVIEQRCVSKGSFPTEGEEERTERQTYQTTVVLGTTQHDLPSKEPGQEAGDAFVSSSVVSGTVEVPSPSVQSSHESAEQELTNSPSVPHRVWNSWLRWEFFTQSGGPEEEISNIAAPPLNLAKRTDHWSWDPEEERKRQERWQQEQERMLQMKYQREQEKLKQEWERAQKEVEEEERKYHEEERKILEETVAPLTPRSSTLSSPSRSDQPHLPLDPEGTIVRSLADWEHKQELLERQARAKEEGVEKDEKLSDNGKQNGVRKEQKMTLKAEEKMTESSHSQSITHTETIVQSQQNGQRLLSDHSPPAVSELQFIQDASWNNKQPLTKQPEEVWKKTASLDRNWSQQQAVTGGMKRSGSYENVGISPSKSSSCSSSLQTQSPNRSVSGKKLCSSCGHPLGKGAAMIIETLSLYFHIQCFKCGICKGQLGDTTTGTDVRIRNGLLNCNECYIKSRTAGQPTTL